MPTVLTEELGMHHVTAKFVPRIPTDDQKQQRVVCTELKNKMAVIPHPP